MVFFCSTDLDDRYTVLRQVRISTTSSPDLHIWFAAVLIVLIGNPVMAAI
jgi:hypothetical protein